MRQSVGDKEYCHSVIDHSIHGLVTVRLVDAPERVVASVIRAIGPSRGFPSDEPDIQVTFTDELPCSPGLRLLGLNDAPFAFDEDSFYLMDDHGRRTRVDFDRLGERCELVCERGVNAVPLLVPIVGLRLLRKGHVLLHSSSFVYDGKGVLIAAWQTGGKTEMLLSFVPAGARYIADEWTIVSAEDGSLRGLAANIQIWSWQFRYLPQYWARIGAADRRRIRLIRLYRRLYHALPGLADGQSLPLRLLRRFERELTRAARSRSPAHVLFRDQIWPGAASLDRVFVATVGQHSTQVSPIEPQEIARRMAASLTYERRGLLAAYDQFRFAFPDRTNEFLEAASEREQRLLSQAFQGRPAYEICHPYPVPLHDLFEAAAPFCSSDSPSAFRSSAEPSGV